MKWPWRRSSRTPERPALRADPVKVAVLEHDIWGIQPEPGTMAAAVIGLRALIGCREHELEDAGTWGTGPGVQLCVRCGQFVAPED